MQSRGLSNRGFTLLELSLVLLIMSVMLGLIIPRLRDKGHAELVSHTRRLAVIVRHLRHEAILNGRVYRLNYDLTEQRYWVTSADVEDEFGAFERDTGALDKEITLPSPIVFADLVLPDTLGRVDEGYGFTDFYPDGYIDLTLVHLDNGQEVYTLFVDSLTGQVSVAAGYHEMPRL